VEQTVTLFKIALGIGAAASLLAFVGVQRMPTPERIVVEKPTLAKFDETWNQAAGATTLKAASLASTEPKPVRIIPIDPGPKTVPPIVITQEDVVTKPKIRHARVERHSDVCSRHGMRKVQRGRSWRCR
jgi:hypothetical protein